MPGAPKVSVALPCFNASATLPACLDSLLAQTLADFEVIAADDGSTDDTWEILAAYAARDARIRPLRLEHAGVARAANAAVAACRAPLIARMDADDLCLPRRLELQTALLEAQPALDLVSSRVRFGGDRAKCRGYALHVDWLNTLSTHEDMAASRFIDSPLANPSVMFRRASWERLGGCRAGDFPEDYEQWLRWLALGARFGKVPEDILVWNDPPARLSRTHPAYAPEAFARVKARYLWRWLKRRNPRHPEVWAWGAGRESRRRLAPLIALGLRVAAYVDIDPKKIGQKVAGAPVLGRNALPSADSDAAPFVLVNVGSRGAREEITAWLAGLGYRLGAGFVAMG